MSSRTDQSDLVLGHHKCTEIPKRKAKVKCTWCNKTMVGNSWEFSENPTPPTSQKSGRLGCVQNEVLWYQTTLVTG